MISKVTIQNFKRFREPTEFILKPEGVTFLAGGNNSGKSTLLQALAVWEFARSVIEVNKGKAADDAVLRRHTYRPLRAASRASAFRMTSGWRRILVVKSRVSVGGKSTSPRSAACSSTQTVPTTRNPRASATRRARRSSVTKSAGGCSCASNTASRSPAPRRLKAGSAAEDGA